MIFSAFLSIESPPEIVCRKNQTRFREKRNRDKKKKGCYTET